MLDFKKICFFVCTAICFIGCFKKHKTFVVFAQLCDTQLGMSNYEKDKKSLEKAIYLIDSMNLDFVVVCGDLVNNAVDSTFNEFNRIIKKSKTPFFLVSGNHDVGNVPTKESLSYYRNRIGKDYYSFKKASTNFIIINTQLVKEEVATESKEHKKWLLSTLKNLNKKKESTIVIGHYPLYINKPDEEEGYFNLPLEQRNLLLDAFVKNNVSAYLSGHSHTFISNTYKGIQLISGETTSKNFDERPLGFRLWKVSQNSATHQFIPLKNSK